MSVPRESTSDIPHTESALDLIDHDGSELSAWLEKARDSGVAESRGDDTPSEYCEGSAKIVECSEISVVKNRYAVFGRELLVRVVREFSEMYIRSKYDQNMTMFAKKLQKHRKVQEKLARRRKKARELAGSAIELDMITSFNSISYASAPPKSHDAYIEWLAQNALHIGINTCELQSHTGIKSIRLMQEVAAVRFAFVNAENRRSLKSILSNIQVNNEVNHERMFPCLSAALDILSQSKDGEYSFDVIDLSPESNPSKYFDGIVQAVAEGGLLCIKFDIRNVIRNNKSCFASFGVYHTNDFSRSNEMPVRIVLSSLERSASTHGRYISPLLCVTPDESWCLQLFVRVFSYDFKDKARNTTRNFSYVFQCINCKTLEIEPLNVVRKKRKRSKKRRKSSPSATFTTSAFISSSASSSDSDESDAKTSSRRITCIECSSPIATMGPVWTAEIHDRSFLEKLASTFEPQSNTDMQSGTENSTSESSKELDPCESDRSLGAGIRDYLTRVLEEVPNVPFNYDIAHMCVCLSSEVIPPKLILMILDKLEYQSSYACFGDMVLKTDAPSSIMWDIVRCWAKQRPHDYTILKPNLSGAMLSKEVKLNVKFSEETIETARVEMIQRRNHRIQHTKWSTGLSNN